MRIDDSSDVLFHIKLVKSIFVLNWLLSLISSLDDHRFVNLCRLVTVFLLNDTADEAIRRWLWVPFRITFKLFFQILDDFTGILTFALFKQFKCIIDLELITNVQFPLLKLIESTNTGIQVLSLLLLKPLVRFSAHQLNVQLVYLLLVGVFEHGAKSRLARPS